MDWVKLALLTTVAASCGAMFGMIVCRRARYLEKLLEEQDKSRHLYAEDIRGQRDEQSR